MREVRPPYHVRTLRVERLSGRGQDSWGRGEGSIAEITASRQGNVLFVDELDGRIIVSAAGAEGRNADRYSDGSLGSVDAGSVGSAAHENRLPFFRRPANRFDRVGDPGDVRPATFSLVRFDRRPVGFVRLGGHVIGRRGASERRQGADPSKLHGPLLSWSSCSLFPADRPASP